MGDDLTDAQMMVELARGDLCPMEVANYIIDFALEKTVIQARENALIKFVDSFGLNHTLELAGLAMCWPHQMKDEVPACINQNDCEEP